MTDTTTAPTPSMEFKEELLRDLDPRLQKQVEAADKTIDKNPTYAIEVCMGILTRNPGCVEVRKILRKAQKKVGATKPKGMGGFLKSFTRTPFAMAGASKIKSDPKAALEETEKKLNEDPGNVAQFKNGGQAAAALGLWQTAASFYENVREVEPQNVPNLLALSAAYIEAGQSKEAIKVADTVNAIQPGNAEAQALQRKASVMATMEKGKWDQPGDFREKLANPAEAKALEQKSRLANDADTLGGMVGPAIDKINREPDNVNLYRELIGTLKQLQRLDDALNWTRKARLTPLGKADTTLEKLESDFISAIMRKQISDLEADLAKAPDAAKQAKLDDLRKQEMESNLAKSRALVEKYPTDYTFRFELGTLLFQTGEFDAAIRELQLARRSPKNTHMAALFLGRAYRKKGIYDLAEEQLEAAKKDLQNMTDIKKEIVYELGHVYRDNKKLDKAMEEFKAIYSADIDYKDVQQIINKFYEDRAKGAS